LGFLTAAFILNRFSKGAFGLSLVAIFTVLAAFLHFGKNPVDSPTASRVLTDFEWAGQSVEIFGAHDLDSFLGH
jgi:hypothetical protein